MVQVDPNWWRRQFGLGWMTPPTPGTIAMIPPAASVQPLLMVPPAASVAPTPPRTESRVAARPSVRIAQRAPELLGGAGEAARRAAGKLVDLGSGLISQLPTKLPSIPAPPARRPGIDINERSVFGNLVGGTREALEGYDPVTLAAKGALAWGNAMERTTQRAADLFNLSEKDYWNKWRTKPDTLAGGPEGDGIVPAGETAAPGAPRGATVPPVEGGRPPAQGNAHPNVIRVWQHLTGERGLTPEQAAGKIATMIVESGDPTLTHAGSGDKGTAHGFFQHRLERDAARRAYHERAPGVDPLMEDIGFAFEEFQGPEAKAWAALRGSRTPTEAAAAMLHFERPRGYDPERFNPAVVEGWGERSRLADQIYEQMYDSDYPPVPPPVQANMTPAPPARRAPPMRPAPVGPDWTELNKWADEARPKPYDTDRGRLDVILGTLSGLASGAASVDPSRNPSALFAAMGAGGMRGLTETRTAEEAEMERRAEALRQYAADRAELAGEIAQVDATTANLQGQNVFLNTTDIYNTGRANEMDVYNTDVQNLRAQQEAEALNRQNQFTYRENVWERGQPKFLGLTNRGAVTQQNGRIGFEPFEGASGVLSILDSAEQTNAMLKVPGGQYFFMQGNMPAIAAGTVKEMIQNGSAQSLWPELYAQAEERARDSLPSEAGYDPDTALDVLYTHIATNLLPLLTQADPEWVKKATGTYGQQWLMRQ